MRLVALIIRWLLGAALNEGMFDDEEVTEVVIRPWTPVHSARGKFTHMSHDGCNTLCGVRLRTLVVSNAEVDCLPCHQALSFN